MPFLTTVVTGDTFPFAISCHMSCLPIFETFPHVLRAFTDTMTNFTIFKTCDPDGSISPIWFLARLSLLFNFIGWGTIWFPAILLFHALLTHHLAMTLGILLVDPTTIHQLRKLADLLIPNRPLNLRTQPTLEFHTFRELGSLCSIMGIKLG